MASTRQDIIDELKQLLEQDATAIKEQVDHLKTQFYSTAEEVSEEAQEGAGRTDQGPGGSRGQQEG